jgi:hypothetical protein
VTKSSALFSFFKNQNKTDFKTREIRGFLLKIMAPTKHQAKIVSVSRQGGSESKRGPILGKKVYFNWERSLTGSNDCFVVVLVFSILESFLV